MARTALTPVVLTANTSTADPAGTAIDATNSHVFTSSSPLDEYVIRIVNTTASTKVATIKAGDNPPADAAGQGDITVSLATGSVTPTVAWVGPMASVDWHSAAIATAASALARRSWQAICKSRRQSDSSNPGPIIGPCG